MRAAPLGAARRAARGFTLVELMVALVAGLFVSMAIFSLAKHSSSFAMRQSRAADATLQSVIGFERLKADIARAGFLSTPNIQRDPAVCRGAALPAQLAQLASVAITAIPSDELTSESSGRTPRRLVLSGSYDSPDLFVARNIDPSGASPVVYLSRSSLGMANIGYPPISADPGAAAAGAAALARVFRAGRLLRIVDDGGKVQFGVINAVTGGDNPMIVLDAAPALQFRAGSAQGCGVRGLGNDFVNVVNIVRYDLRNLSGTAGLAPMYRGGPASEATRQELVREELDADGAALGATPEVIAEYAIDLDFSLLVEQGNSGRMQRVSAGNISNFAGPVNAGGGNGPQQIRAVHAWLSVRSQEADRTTALPAAASAAPGPRALRVSLHPTDSTQPPFARVRTLQAVIPLNNQARATW